LALISHLPSHRDQKGYNLSFPYLFLNLLYFIVVSPAPKRVDGHIDIFTKKRMWEGKGCGWGERIWIRTSGQEH
jgi:hypothetical protein